MRYEKCMKSRAFSMPMQKVQDGYVRIDRSTKSIMNQMQNKLNTCKAGASKTIAKLDTLSPLKTLTRGYCLAEAGGAIVKSAKSLKEKDEVNLIFTDGSRKAQII